MSRLDTMLNWLDRTFIKPVEESRLPVATWFVLFYAIAVIRNIIEGATELIHVIGFSPITMNAFEDTFLHMPAFYLAIFLMATIALRLVTRVPISRITKLTFTYGIIIVIPPLIDPLFSTRGFRLLYPTEASQLTSFAVSWFNAFTGFMTGTSPGMRIETVVAAVFVFVYGFIRSRHIARAGLALLLGAIGVALVGFLPSFVPFLAGLAGGHPYPYGEVYYGGALITTAPRRWLLLDLILLVPVLLVWLQLYKPALLRHFFRALRSARLALYLGMPLLGFLVGWALLHDVFTTLFANPFDWLLVLALVASAFFVAGAARLWGDYVRHGLAGQTAPDGATPQEHKALIVSSAAFGLLFGFCVGYVFFFLAVLALAVSLVYAGPPLRLARFWPLSAIIAGVIAVTGMVAGFSAFTGGRAWEAFPHRLALAVFVLVVLGWASKDRLRGERDRAQGTYSLFALAGARAWWVNAALVLVSFLVVPAILNYPGLFVAAVPLGLLAAFLVLQRWVGVGWVSIVYLVLGIFVAGLTVQRRMLFEPLLVETNRSLGYFLEGENRSESAISDPTLYAPALAAYRQVDTTRLHEDWLHFRIGYALLRLDSIPAGLAEVQAFARSPVLAYQERALPMLGFSYLYAQQGPDGVQAYRQAIAHNFDPGTSARQVGVHYKLSRELEQGITYFDQAYRLGEARDEDLRQAGDYYHARGDLAQATAYYRRAIAYNPDYVSAYLRLGSIYWSAERYDDARRLYEQALRRQPNEPMLWNNLGMALVGVGRAPQAARALIQALALNPRFVEAYDNLATLYENNGFIKEAIQVYQRLLQVDPDNVSARSALERLQQGTPRS